MIYVQAGLYAEGPTDYDLLIPLIDRLLAELVARHPAAFADLPPPIGLSDEPGDGKRRRERIAAAIERNWHNCTLFVIHADADGDWEGARERNVLPGLVEARQRLGVDALPAAACVPVREIEAWLLADAGVFQKLYPSSPPPVLPQDPERVGDPKRQLQAVFSELQRRRPKNLFAACGENVSLEALRRLPAFRAFEAELSGALDLLARS